MLMTRFSALVVAYIVSVSMLMGNVFRMPTPASAYPQLSGYPQGVYRAQYEEARTCITAAGLPIVGGSFDSIKWREAPGREFLPASGVREYAIGEWVKPDTIILAHDWIGTPWVPKHEMIHYLAQRSHYGGDSTLWGRSCHAMWSYLDPDTAGMMPGATGTYRRAPELIPSPMVGTWSWRP